MIYARQMKAARALLDWSQQDLAAAASVSPTTVRNMESGDISPRHATAQIIRRIFEESGIEFTEGEGVRRRNDAVVIFQGEDASDMFFEDVLHTVQQKGGDIVGIFKSHQTLIESCGIMPGNLGHLAAITQLAMIRCITPTLLSSLPTSSSFQSRAIPKQYIGPSSYIAYGNKYAIILDEACSLSRFIVFTCASTSQEYRKHFHDLWEMALSGTE